MSAKSLALGFISAALIFLVASLFRVPEAKLHTAPPDGEVVIAAPIQLLMYAGDPYLAANVEFSRAAATGPASEEARASYRIRAHRVVAQLNPCHEDNYYLGNAMLSWGGSEDEGNAILMRATECRFWDELPPFYLGFNRYFFYRDLSGAQEALEIAAERSEINRASLRRMSIMLAAQEFDDDQMAMNYLRIQREEATDPRLVNMLDTRITRLDALITLRQAQAKFEKNAGRPLAHPNELLEHGLIMEFPEDPMGLGFIFEDGQIRLRTRVIQGIEMR